MNMEIPVQPSSESRGFLLIAIVMGIFFIIASFITGIFYYNINVDNTKCTTISPDTAFNLMIVNGLVVIIGIIMALWAFVKIYYYETVQVSMSNVSPAAPPVPNPSLSPMNIF